ncbi:MAG TPA: nucleotidyltransferase family protein [Thermoanaerobaculia bacterium]|nr:nucleotidyltransferase family protein [Thermoanaerobaculia bacterium]
MTAGELSAVATTPAIVLAGGRGTRIAPVTGDKLPKALLPVAGRPFLEHQLGWLASEGVRRVVLAVGFLGDQLRSRFGDRWGELELDWSDDGERLLGTGGAVRRAFDRLGGDARAFVANGDTWFPVPLAALLARHCESGATATVALARQEERGRFGAVESDAAGRITAFHEKGSVGGGWINGGVYCLERAALEGMPSGEPLSLERDLLAARLGTLRVLAFPCDRPFCDIGVPASYGAFAAAEPRR